MRRTFVQFPSKEQLLSAIADFRAELAKYKGEPVVAHQDPLHHAAVSLERLCVRASNFQQSHYLPYPLSAYWFRLLWASRDGKPKCPIEDWLNGPIGPANPKLAKQWRDVLLSALSTFADRIDEYLLIRQTPNARRDVSLIIQGMR